MNQMKDLLAAEKSKSTELTAQLVKANQETDQARRHATVCEERANKLLRDAQDEDRVMSANIGGSHQVVSKVDRSVRGILEPKGTVIGFITPSGGYSPNQVADAACRGSASIQATAKEADFAKEIQNTERLAKLEEEHANARTELAKAKALIEETTSHCESLEVENTVLKEKNAELVEAGKQDDDDEENENEKSD